MTNQQHPITSPPELVKQWLAEIWHEGAPVQVAVSELHITTRAAQWGADQELEACCEWFDRYIPGYEGVVDRLRAARRPKPPSLAEEALQALDEADAGLSAMEWPQRSDQIRRALERLQQLEEQQ